MQRFVLDNGQCEVKCDKAGNYTEGENKRNGIMPDGTPCSHSQLSSLVENNNLPRRSGMFGKCVQGYCFVSLLLKWYYAQCPMQSLSVTATYFKRLPFIMMKDK